jgi:N-ethylmaleimide reductase
LTGRRTQERLGGAYASGYADLVAFGRPFIANPDLVERLRRDAGLNALDTEHLFGAGAL